MKHTYNWLAKKKQMITQYILNMQHDARLVHIAFLMDKVVLGQIFYSSKYCSFPSQFLKRCTSGTYLIVRFLRHTIVCTYSIYKEAPEDGPLRSETCRADTWVLINNQCCYVVYLVGMYIYCKKNDTWTFQCQVQRRHIVNITGRPSLNNYLKQSVCELLFCPFAYL